MTNNNNHYPRSVLKEVEDYFHQELEHLQSRLKQLDEEDPFLDPDHTNDNADITTDVREELSHMQASGNRDSLLKRRDEIKNALERIEKGNYGFCENCGQLIDTDRLSTNPLAKLCITCAKK